MKTIFRLIIVGGTLVPLFFTPLLYAKTVVSIIDTGFCMNRIPKDVKVKIIDTTESNFNYCKTSNMRRLHGQRVLESFLKVLPKKLKEEIEINAYIVFDLGANQKIEYWDKALKNIEKNNSKFVITSVLLPLKKNINPFPNFQTPIFIASARKQRGIDESIYLWPLSWKSEQMIVVGGKLFGKKDPKELYPKLTDTYGEESSSISNATFAATSLIDCQNAKQFVKCAKGGLNP